MKCKRCYAKMPLPVLESVCPECGWRTPSLSLLLITAMLSALLCILFLVQYAIARDPYAGYMAPASGAVAVGEWTHYVIVRKRRMGLGYSD